MSAYYTAFTSRLDRFARNKAHNWSAREERNRGWIETKQGFAMSRGRDTLQNCDLHSYSQPPKARYYLPLPHIKAPKPRKHGVSQLADDFLELGSSK